MFYNFFISGNKEDWEDNSEIFESRRCIKIKEYTAKEIVNKYIRFANKEINEPKTFPCIFDYEVHLNKD